MPLVLPSPNFTREENVDLLAEWGRFLPAPEMVIDEKAFWPELREIYDTVQELGGRADSTWEKAVSDSAAAITRLAQRLPQVPPDELRRLYAVSARAFLNDQNLLKPAPPPDRLLLGAHFGHSRFWDALGSERLNLPGFVDHAVRWRAGLRIATAYMPQFKSLEFEDCVCDGKNYCQFGENEPGVFTLHLDRLGLTAMSTNAAEVLNGHELGHAFVTEPLLDLVSPSFPGWSTSQLVRALNPWEDMRVTTIGSLYNSRLKGRCADMYQPKLNRLEAILAESPTPESRHGNECFALAISHCLGGRSNHQFSPEALEWWDRIGPAMMRLTTAETIPCDPRGYFTPQSVQERYDECNKRASEVLTEVLKSLPNISPDQMGMEMMIGGEKPKAEKQQQPSNGNSPTPPPPSPSVEPKPDTDPEADDQSPSPQTSGGEEQGETPDQEKPGTGAADGEGEETPKKEGQESPGGGHGDEEGEEPLEGPEASLPGNGGDEGESQDPQRPGGEQESMPTPAADGSEIDDGQEEPSPASLALLKAVQAAQANSPSQGNGGGVDHRQVARRETLLSRFEREHGPLIRATARGYEEIYRDKLGETPKYRVGLTGNTLDPEAMLVRRRVDTKKREIFGFQPKKIVESRATLTFVLDVTGSMYEPKSRPPIVGAVETLSIQILAAEAAGLRSGLALFGRASEIVFSPDAPLKEKRAFLNEIHRATKAHQSIGMTRGISSGTYAKHALRSIGECLASQKKVAGPHLGIIVTDGDLSGEKAAQDLLRLYKGAVPIVAICYPTASPATVNLLGRNNVVGVSDLSMGASRVIRKCIGSAIARMPSATTSDAQRMRQSVESVAQSPTLKKKEAVVWKR